MALADMDPHPLFIYIECLQDLNSMDGWMIMIAFLAKLPPTTNNSWILQRLIGQLNNHKINHLFNLQIVKVNKQCLLHNRHREPTVNKYHLIRLVYLCFDTFNL